MSKLDNIKPTGYDGRYKVELQVEGEWVAMALLSKEAICEVADLMTSEEFDPDYQPIGERHD